MGPYCKFCNQRCFVPLPVTAPAWVLKAYGRFSLAATCKRGKEFDREQVGANIDDARNFDVVGNFFQQGGNVDG